MNKTKAKALIKKLEQINKMVGEIEKELYFENLLSYIYDYTSITIKDLKRVFHIE